MKCPNCGREMVKDVRNMAYSRKNRTLTIEAVCGLFCPACGESVLDAAEAERVSRCMLEFNQSIEKEN